MGSLLPINKEQQKDKSESTCPNLYVVQLLGKKRNKYINKVNKIMQEQGNSLLEEYYMEYWCTQRIQRPQEQPKAHLGQDSVPIVIT